MKSNITFNCTISPPKTRKKKKIFLFSFINGVLESHWFLNFSVLINNYAQEKI